jgi:DNA-binding transcriptional LysR family regulator
MLLSEIDAFVHVAEAGSFSIAARQLGVPKSTLSRAISRLEDSTSVRLFERTTRSVRLTEAGRLFFERANPHTAGLRDAMAALGNEREQPSGTLRLTAAPDAAELLSEAAVPFAARYPALCVQVELSVQVVNLAAEGFDAGLRGTTRLRDASLMARLLTRVELQLFAAPSYLARRGTPSQVEDLARHDCALFRAQGQDEEWRLQSSTGSRSVRIRGRIGGNEFPFIRAAVIAGAGVGRLPSFFAKDDVTAGRLTRVLPEWSSSGGGFYFVYPRGRHVPKRVIAFRDFLFENFKTKFS